MRVAPVIVVMIPLLTAGCESQKKQEPAPVVSTPLELDPTHEYELPAWWTNGAQLLHLDDDSRYALYEGVNRYHQPRQRGQWWQQSYAAIQLEPYAPQRRDAARGSIRRVGPSFLMSLPGLEPMMGLDGPPPVLEDRLVGRWSAEFGSLRLDADLRYVYTLNPGPVRPPAGVTTHGGVWRVAQDIVVLRPDSATLAPVLVRIVEADGGIVLELPEGRLDFQAPLIEPS